MGPPSLHDCCVVLLRCDCTFGLFGWLRLTCIRLPQCGSDLLCAVDQFHGRGRGKDKTAICDLPVTPATLYLSTFSGWCSSSYIWAASRSLFCRLLLAVPPTYDARADAAVCARD